MDRSQLSQLAVLSTVATHGNFRAAARELGIAPSAVSHAVSTLEQRLGVRLLHRTTRSVAPTEAGARLLERLQPALGEIDAAVGAAIESGNRPAGVLRITAPRTAVHLVLAPRLAGFAAAYPNIVLDLVTEDRFTDVVVGGFDAGVRLGESLQPDMIAVRIGPSIRGAVVGSPAYFSRHKRPLHPNDLTEHRCIRMRFSSGALYHWEFEKNGKALDLEVNGPLILGEDTVIVEVALSGAGLAFVFEDYVSKAIDGGQLVRVLDDWCPPFDGFFAYYPSGRQMRPALRAFVDFFRVPGRME